MNSWAYPIFAETILYFEITSESVKFNNFPFVLYFYNWILKMHEELKEEEGFACSEYTLEHESQILLYFISLSICLFQYFHRSDIWHSTISFFPKLLTNLAPSNISMCQCRGQCTCDVTHSAAQCKSERFVQIEARHASKRFIDSSEHWRDVHSTHSLLHFSLARLYCGKILKNHFDICMEKTIEREGICVHQSRG